MSARIGVRNEEEFPSCLLGTLGTLGVAEPETIEVVLDVLILPGRAPYCFYCAVSSVALDGGRLAKGQDPVHVVG